MTSKLFPRIIDLKTLTLVANLCMMQIQPVLADIQPTRDALALAQAISDQPSTVVGASFVALPPAGNPAAISTTLLGEFPTSGASFAILSTGDATAAQGPNGSENMGTDNGGQALRGARDVTILKIDLNVPNDVSCLSVRYRFLSEEFPEFVGSAFNDAFIAELDNNSWQAGGQASPGISAPDNFAFDTQNLPISVNSVGELSVSPESASGTAYDGATRRLRASTPVTPGPHSLYLSIFDQGDSTYDSAAFIDRLTLSNLTACTPGAAVDLTSFNPAGLKPLPDGLFSVPIASVFSPTVLVIEEITYPRRRARKGQPFRVRVVITDTRGFRIRDARVRLLGIPTDNLTRNRTLTKITGNDGTVRFRVNPRSSRSSRDFLYVRADRPGAGRGCEGICATRVLIVRR